MNIRKTQCYSNDTCSEFRSIFQATKKYTNILQAPYVTLLVHWNLRFPRSRVGYACLKHRP